MSVNMSAATTNLNTSNTSTNTHLLDSLYGDVTNPSGLSSVKKLWQNARLYNPDIKLSEVKGYLKGQDSYTLHGNIRRKYLKTPVYVSKPGELLSADLGDFQSLKEHNDGVKYLLVVIDCFSRKLHVSALYDKKGDTVADALDKILEQEPLGHSYTSLWVDLGGEFHNKFTLAVCRKYNIKLYSTYNRGTKAVYAERVLQTLKTKIFRALTHYNSKNYMQFLEGIVKSYNSSSHKGLLGDTPVNVHGMKDRNEIDELSQNMFEQKFKNYGNRLYKENSPPTTVSIGNKVFTSGDYVRLIGDVTDSAFVKSYDQVYTLEIFQIASVILDTPPIYKLKDLSGDPIEGTVYAQEIKLVEPPEFYKVEEILRKKKNNVTGKIEYYVKYVGYPSKFNSWIQAEQMRQVSTNA